MQKLPLETFEKLTKGAHALDTGDREKILLRPDGLTIRLFPRANLFSVGRLYPQAVRFRNKAKLLNEFGINTIEVGDVYTCRETRNDLVIYPRLEGTPLKEVMNSKPETLNPILDRLAKFLAMLHYKAIYFPSFSLQNVLLLPSGEFGLINISDLKLKSVPMGPLIRARNIRQVFSHEGDLTYFREFGLKRFIRSYLLSSGMLPFFARIFLKRLSPSAKTSHH
jgi:hypothetical protein